MFHASSTVRERDGRHMLQPQGYRPVEIVRSQADIASSIPVTRSSTETSCNARSFVIPGLPGHRLRGLAFIVAFTTLGVISLVAPMVSAWLTLGLIPLGFALGRLDRGHVGLL